MDAAFESAQTETVVLAFTHHDFRDMVPDVRDMQRMIENALRRFPVPHGDQHVTALDDGPAADVICRFAARRVSE